jgi:hypothetical protein
MKKNFFRSVVIVAILGGAAVLLVWYWTMKRSVPEQARVIPSDVIAVLTLNLRDLAADRSGDEHLFPEMAGQPVIGKELEPFTRAIANNNGATGIDETADVLVFIYHTGDAGFVGVALELEDSAAFGNLMRVHVAKEYNIQPLSLSGVPVMRFDTTAAAFGWTEDAALLLYPLGNHSIATVSSQCAKLLKQNKESSVLMNEKFREMEMKSFAMGLWIQTKPLLGFTEGGAMIEAIAHDVESYSYLADFADGEILVRSEWHLANETKRAMIKEFAFPCDTSLIRSFQRGHFDITTDSVPSNSFADEAFDKLPIAEEEYAMLFSTLTGDYISVRHSDTGANSDPETHCFLLSEPGKAKAFISAAMQRDSIPLTASGWKYTAVFDEHWRMMISDNLLTITNHPDVDGRPHSITPDLAGYMAWYDLQAIFTEMQDKPVTLLPLAGNASALFAAHLTTCSSTLPVQFGNVRHSEIVLRFRNKEVNGLVQIEELVRKIYFGK